MFLQTIVIDSRSMFDYNNGHVTGAINVSGSKLAKRRLANNAVSIIVQETMSIKRWYDM